MNRATKAITAALLALILALSLVSCGTTAVKADIVTTRDPGIAPWAESVAYEARSTKTLRIYTLTACDLDGGERGDSTLFVFPNGKTMLIDVGVKAMGDYIGKSLNALGITHLDYLVITHQHSDHAYGVTQGNLLDYVTVGCCYTNGVYSANWKNPLVIEETMAAHGIPCEYLVQDQVLTIGGVTVTVLGPDKSLVGTTVPHADVNQSSLVLKFQYGDTSCLMTADMYVEDEQDLIERYGEDVLECDVMKIAHHGEDTSSSQAFLEAVDPDYVFCIGRDPVSVSLYRRLKTVDDDIQVYMDGADGFIRFVLDGDDVEVTCSKQRGTTVYDQIDMLFN